MYKILAKTLILGKKVVYLPTCHSTNDSARSLTKTGSVFEGTIVITNDQTLGKGQMGNAWESRPNENLTFSIILKPNFIPANKQFLLSMAVALGIVDFLRMKVEDFQVKWPNDIYHGTRKVAGILIQNTLNGNMLDQSIVGIGLNVNQVQFEVPNATSLKIVGERYFELAKVLEDLCYAIEKRYLQLKRGDYRQIKIEYLEQLLGYQQIRDYSDGDVFQGKIVDILDSGQLVLERSEGRMHYDFKEIKFLFS